MGDLRHLFRPVGASDGSTMCMLQIQPNGMMGGGGTIGVSDLVGQMLGGLLGGSEGGNSAGNAAAGQAIAGLAGSLVNNLFGRRLQYGQDPTEDIWMIGGVFLEH